MGLLDLFPPSGSSTFAEHHQSRSATICLPSHSHRTAGSGRWVWSSSSRRGQDASRINGSILVGGGSVGGHQDELVDGSTTGISSLGRLHRLGIRTIYVDPHGEPSTHSPCLDSADQGISSWEPWHRATTCTHLSTSVSAYWDSHSEQSSPYLLKKHHGSAEPDTTLREQTA